MRWLLTIHYSGGILRLSDAPCSVTTERGDVFVFEEGLLEDIQPQQALQLPGETGGQAALSLSLVLPVDLAALEAQGYELHGAVAEVSRWREGDPWESRIVVLAGKVRDPEYGMAGEAVGLTIEDPPWLDTVQVPSPLQRVDGVTWPDSILTLQEQSLATLYPLVIGCPGRTDSSWGAGSLARWVWHDSVLHGANYSGLILVVASHHVSAERVYINTSAYTPGFRCVVFNGTDGRGQPIAYIPWYASRTGTDEPYDYDGAGAYTWSLLPDTDGLNSHGLGANYAVGSTFISALTTDSSEPQFWVGWRDDESAARGGLTIGGVLIRAAGDVLEYLLSLTSAGVDRGRVAAAKPLLAGFNIDVSIDEPTSPWEIIASYLLPILPVSIVRGPSGFYPVVWRWGATAADAIAHLDADADPYIQRVSKIRVDGSKVCNDFSLDYALSRRTGSYSATARLGAGPYDADDPAAVSLACRKSQGRYGVVSKTFQAEAIWEGATAQGVLGWMAAAYSSVHRRISYLLTEGAFPLELGAVVTLSHAEMSLDRRVCLVESIQWRPAGAVEVGFILLN